MTDNEIIKGLELCPKKNLNGECTQCPYYKSDGTCFEILMADSLELINRQKAEIKRLTSGKCVYLSDDETTEYCVEGPCPKYKTEEQIKAEVVKECFEKVRERLTVHSFTSNPTEYTDGQLDCMEWVDSKIDELEKEMVGDNNAT